jgi:protein-S-isoprenylcysteine O-methyltransferase Ste14
MWSVAGAAVALSGVALRWWSIGTLKERFRGFDVRQDARGVETRGPYAFIRHPGYLALILLDAALPLLLGVPWLLPLALLPIASVVRRIAIEEALLAQTYGEAYTEYRRRTGRLVRGVW